MLLLTIREDEVIKIGEIYVHVELRSNPYGPGFTRKLAIEAPEACKVMRIHARSVHEAKTLYQASEGCPKS